MNKFNPLKLVDSEEIAKRIASMQESDMQFESECKTAYAWSETKWYAECPHCYSHNEVDAHACASGAAHEATCEVCRKQFGFRARP